MKMKKKSKNPIKSISIIIPAYNEEDRLASRLDEIIRYVRREEYDYEIIIVDDGSTDKTSEKARRYIRTDKNIKLLQNLTNRGKGFSVKRGVLASKKNPILITDADKSTSIGELAKLLRFIKEYDIIIGSRGLEESDVKIRQPIYRVLLGKAGNLLIQLLATPRIKDTQCGFKLFKRRTIQIFNWQTIDGWGFDFEILFIAKKQGFKIREVPITWMNDGKSKVKFTAYLFTLIDLLRVKSNEIKHRYDL